MNKSMLLLQYCYNGALRLHMLMELPFFGFAGAVWVCDSLSGGGGDNGQITVECRAEDKHP